MDSSSSSFSFLRQLTAPAEEIYETLDFNTDSVYNQPAPAPWISFVIGGILGLFSFIATCLRYRTLYQRIQKEPDELSKQLTTKGKMRMALAAWLDNDSARFTVMKMGFYSFLFLGGFQLNYSATFIAMLAGFTLESVAEAARVLIAFSEVDDLKDLVAVSKIQHREIKKNHYAKKIVLEPSNVYEDLSRSKAIVVMIFVLQCIMISFVVADIFASETLNCRDGTKGCPIVGTFGSWCFYIVGIFMQTVYLLGPKTNFGRSEQNPAFWIQLLLAANGNTKDQSTVTCHWFDPNKDKDVSFKLTHYDVRVWIRFLLSFLINGVGFHVLIHALPIQVAGQSTLSGVVLKAVGVMYLVDLDDSKGLTLTITDDRNKESTTTDNVDSTSSGDENNKAAAAAQSTTTAVATAVSSPLATATAAALTADVEFQAKMKKIVEQARAEIDALAMDHGVVPEKKD